MRNSSNTLSNIKTEIKNINNRDEKQLQEYNRYHELLKNPLVQEYLSLPKKGPNLSQYSFLKVIEEYLSLSRKGVKYLKYYLNERRYEDYQQIFLKYAKRGEITSNIWVYIGSFQKENTIRKECVHYTSDPSSIDFNWYCNILSSHIYEQVEPGSIELFEQNHIIIKFFDYRRSAYLSQRLSMFYYEQILAGLSEEEILEQLMNSSNNEFEIEEIIIPGKKKYQKERKVDNNE